MKYRIINTSFGYVVQAKSTSISSWECVDDGGEVWHSPKNIYKYCTYYTQWGAKLVIRGLVKKLKLQRATEDWEENVREELNSPQVVYETEV